MGRLLELSGLGRTFVARHLTRRRAASALVGLGIAMATALTLAYTIALPERLGLQDSEVVEYDKGQAAYVFLSEDDKLRIPITLDEVDPDFVDALIRLEDKRFFAHPGADPFAILRALTSNLTHANRVSGASTITMQLVRLLEPRPRTYASKCIEILRAMQLELRLSKEVILMNYLRFAPYGRNIEGVQAASHAYFGKSARALSAAERATLLAVPQNPNQRYPSADNRSRLKLARDSIARQLLREGLLERTEGSETLSAEDALTQIVDTPVPHVLQPIPRQAPHFAQWLKAHYPNTAGLKTYLDPGIQRSVEQIMNRWGEQTTSKNIDHGGALVVEHATGKLRAVVGNLSYDRTRPGSHIPFFDVVRSPGSILKPFLYAMAIDRRLVHSRTLVEDIPPEASAWQPENFDGEFDGLVRLEDALSRSLNMPFIHLLARLGVPDFLATLRTIGARHLESKHGYYGLSAAVGGVDVTALEIVGMFTLLAADGEFKPLRLLDISSRDSGSSSEFAPVQVFTSEATWMTRKALEIRDRPDAPNRRHFNPNIGQIHWKTGTSYGNRDAWAAGSGQNYTVLVWFGNLDHRSSHALVGAEQAGPVLFDILEAIEFGELEADPEPLGMTDIEVCAYSGRLPTDACEQTSTVRAPRRSVPSQRCPYHKLIDVDDATGLALTPHCRGDKSYRTRSFLVWPARLRRFVDSHSRARHRVPELHPECTTTAHASAPTIVSPPHSQRLVLAPHKPSDQQKIPLQAETAMASEKLDWFVNGKLVGTASAQDSVWWTPQPGVHEIVVSDTAGRSAKRTLEVR